MQGLGKRLIFLTNGEFKGRLVIKNAKSLDQLH